MLPNLPYPALIHHPPPSLLINTTMSRLLQRRPMSERNLRRMACQPSPSPSHPTTRTKALRQAKCIPIDRERIDIAVRVHERWIAPQRRRRQPRRVALRVRRVLLVMRHAVRATAESLHRWAHLVCVNFGSRRVARSGRRSWAEREAQPGNDDGIVLRDVESERLLECEFYYYFGFASAMEEKWSCGLGEARGSSTVKRGARNSDSRARLFNWFWRQCQDSVHIAVLSCNHSDPGH